MASGPQRSYTREMQNRFGYYATWTPGTPVALGDVGVIGGGVFRRLQTLRDLDIDFEVRPDDTKERLEYASASSVEFTFKAAGKPALPDSFLTDAKAGVTVEFKREGGVAFEAIGCTTPSIEDQYAVGQEVIRRFRDGRWNRNWVVVTEVVHAESCTVLVSESRGAKISIEASAGVGVGNFSIADASLGLGITFSRSMNTRIVASEGLMPLFRVRRVRKRFLGGPIFRAMRVDPLDLVAPSDVSEEELAFEPDDFVIDDVEPPTLPPTVDA